MPGTTVNQKTLDYGEEMSGLWSDCIFEVIVSDVSAHCLI